MRKTILALATICLLLSINTIAQNIQIEGTVRDSATGAGLQGVSVQVAGTSTGTFTNSDGSFRIQVPSLPARLIFTSISYLRHEVQVTSATPLNVILNLSTLVGDEVVVAATRAPERAINSPVTIERMGPQVLRNLATPNYYEAISNLKGVDMHTASLTFRTVTTRGFVSSGNTRLNQLIDGMDNQAPGLNFAVGGVIGITELDLDNIELLAGASSALYGSGGMNGTLLLTSKNPFRYQGLSVHIKQGIMHVDGSQRDPAPYYDWGVRYAKAFKDKIAFKIAAQLTKAEDWQADDYRNVRRTSVLSKVVGGDRITDPNYDGINMYGDETTVNIRDLALLIWSGAGMPATFPGTPVPSTYFLNPINFPNQQVSRTGYEEEHLVDYNTMNVKFTGGLHYKITPSIEASWNSYLGTGTTVYTGADRYSLRNLKMAQHKLEFRAPRWFLRGYTTQENAGDSYNATVLGRLINEAAKPSFSIANVPGSWYTQYIAAYLSTKYASGGNEYLAHLNGRNLADAGRFLPGTPQYDAAAKTIRSRAIPQGAKFLDKSDLWAAEGQLNLSDIWNFNDKVGMIAGAQWKQYVLNSQGTLFADTAGTITVSEYGAYAQLMKSFIDERLTLTAAGRYDKHTNFEGKFTPRFTAVFKVSENNNVRFSYQTAYRFPTNQDQYINLNVGSGLLIGGLPEFQTYYQLNTNKGYTAESVADYRGGGNPANTIVLKEAVFAPMKPETVSSFELGYKGILMQKLFVDVYGYYSQYQDFLGRVAVVQSMTGAQTGVFNPLTSRNLSYIQNTDKQVSALGWGIGAEYRLPRNFLFYGNIFSDELRDVPDGFATFFNAPRYRWNIGLRNENVWKNIGMNVVVKWQDNNYYEGTFVTGTLPYFTWVDAQVTYRQPGTKNSFRIGGANIGNNYYRTGYGSPYVGGLYYVSYGYNL